MEPQPMADFSVYVQVATIVSALAKALDTGLNYYEALKDVEADPTKIESDAKSLSNTYSDDEIRSILDRIQGCRDRFIDEGHGKNRQRCICSVLSDARDGNGGTLPIDEWNDMYERLGCTTG
jgi:hypothetical protein